MKRVGIVQNGATRGHDEAYHQPSDHKIRPAMTGFIVAALMVLTSGVNLADCSSVRSSVVNKMRAITQPFK